MPIYEYLCSECGHVQERLRPVSERRESGACEACGAEARFIISRPRPPVIHATALERLNESYKTKPHDD